MILGGHSLGASLTTIYAAWDFDGRPGHRDVDGLVLIDGGTLGSFTVPSLQDTREELEKLRTGSPFADLLGLGLPWAAGVFAQAGAVAALQGADGALRRPGLPAAAGAVQAAGARRRTAALLGFAFDKDDLTRGAQPDPRERRAPGRRAATRATGRTAR